MADSDDLRSPRMSERSFPLPRGHHPQPPIKPTSSPSSSPMTSPDLRRAPITSTNSSFVSGSSKISVLVIFCAFVSVQGLEKKKQGRRKKLDTSSFESHVPLLAGADNIFSDLSNPPSFDLPIRGNFNGFQKDAIQMVKPAKGTTMLAFIFKDSAMVVADSRTSMGGYISSQSVKKIIEINPCMLGTVAGVAADCQFWHRNLGIKCRLHKLENKRRISVTGASKLLANNLYSYHGMGQSIGTIIAGRDETGPGLYYVDSEGGRLKGTRYSVGSGSPYAYGAPDNGYRFDMSIKEAVKLARQAIYHATFRDGASGGIARVYHVGPNGWKLG